MSATGLWATLCMQGLSKHACYCSYLFTYFVTVPHSILTQLAWPLSNAQQGDKSFLARNHRGHRELQRFAGF